VLLPRHEESRLDRKNIRRRLLRFTLRGLTQDPELKIVRTFDVVITCNYSPWSRYTGGGQKSAHMLASAMAREGKKVCVVFSKSPWERVPIPRNLPYTVRWAFFFGIRSGVSSPLRFLNGIAYLRTVRGLCGPDTLVIGNGDEASLLHRIVERGLFIYASRNTYEDFLSGSDWSRSRIWLRVFCKEPRYVAVAMAARHADFTVTTSGFSRTQLIRSFGVSAALSHVIPNGLDPAFIMTGFKESGQKGIVYFGRLARNKGVDHALAAFLRLPASTRAEHPFTIVGSGPLKSELLRMIDAAGAQDEVRFTGWLPGCLLAETIVSHRLALLPSMEESFGNAIIEALATGQNLVTTNACSIPEVAGPYGTLIAPGDIEAMAKAVQIELLRTRSDEDIAEQRRHFRERFSWNATARMYLQLGASAAPPVTEPVVIGS
jgi:glycosyltransferase involved in cell wall biosynthesis